MDAKLIAQGYFDYIQALTNDMGTMEKIEFADAVNQFLCDEARKPSLPQDSQTKFIREIQARRRAENK